MDTKVSVSIEREINETRALLGRLLEDQATMDSVAAVAQRCIAVLSNGHKIMLAGNGGSAADAQHLAAEFVSRFNFDRPGLPGIALTTDTSILTAVGNDYGYEELFARQIAALGSSGDLFIAISTSGRSKNILAALRECRKRDIITVGLTGGSGGDMLHLCDYCLRMPSNETPKIQEGHIVIGHIVCGIVEAALFQPKP